MGETIRNRDAGTSGLTVQHQPDTHTTDCHAASVTLSATSGRASALHAYSENPAAPAALVQGAGDLLDLRNATGASKFSVSQTGIVTVAGTTLGNAATRNVGTTAGTVAAGDDARFSSGGGGTSIRTASVRITDDNLGGLPSASSWTIAQTSVNTKLQCSITASASDRIKVYGGFMRAGSHFLDWVLLDNTGAIAIYAGTFTSSPLPEGDPDLYPSLSFGFEEMVEMFTVGAGHINAGHITVALAHQGTGSGIVYAHTTYPFRMRLENIGAEPA